MRRVAGFGLLALGVVVAIVGAVGAVAFGPDDRMTTGSREIDTDARAVVTRPAVLARYGPQVSVQIEVPDDKPVFLGLANTVDLDDYLASTQRVEITRYRVPWSVSTKPVTGDQFLPAAPTALDWWLEQTSGVGGAQLRFDLPDESVSLAALAMGDADLSGLQVTAAYEVPGAFGVSVGTAVFGVGVALLGVVVAGLVPAVRRRPPGVETPGLTDDEWDEPWLETDPADADTWDDFLDEEAVPTGAGAKDSRAGAGAASRPAKPPRRRLRPWSRRAAEAAPDRVKEDA
ncbi:hypothetical protein [Mumia sp. Pv 4-285]|uniref:hypothetical protein n=1 Tax=Mumia qirimensis TaxID=3234852 RepID=UPI00351D8AE8